MKLESVSNLPTTEIWTNLIRRSGPDFRWHRNCLFYVHRSLIFQGDDDGGSGASNNVLLWHFICEAFYRESRFSAKTFLLNTFLGSEESNSLQNCRGFFFNVSSCRCKHQIQSNSDACVASNIGFDSIWYKDCTVTFPRREKSHSLWKNFLHIQIQIQDWN